jgi:hypothetical protein
MLQDSNGRSHVFVPNGYVPTYTGDGVAAKESGQAGSDLAGPGQGWDECGSFDPESTQAMWDQLKVGIFRE